MEFFTQFAAVSVALIGILYIYIKYFVYNYWTSKGIYQLEPSVPFGNILPVLSGKMCMGEFLRDAYLKSKKHPVCGIYAMYKPTLIINDLELIKTVLTKEFASFYNRGLFANYENEPLLQHLFFLDGSSWKNMRTKLTPTFTSGKIKQMFPIVKECSSELADCIATNIETSGTFDIKDILARYTTDTIATIAFGIKAHSLENPDADFRKYGRKFLEPKPVTNGLIMFLPSALKFIGLKMVVDEVANFFTKTFTDVVEYRTANGVVRHDFLNLLLQMIDKESLQAGKTTSSSKLEDSDENKITMMEAAAQAFVFWVAGFETSSSTLGYCIYELCRNQELQDRVAQEINEAMPSMDNLDYETVHDGFPLLHKVLLETMRKYPSLPLLNRICTQDIDLPDINVRIARGTPIVIPTLGIHSDPDLYPDPERFDPERFSSENTEDRHQYAHLPFGNGPRICIGMRFAFVQTKLALISMLSKYRFSPGPAFEVPLQIDPGNILLITKNPMQVRAVKR